MVEFSNDTNFSYILNNDTISNKTQRLELKHRLPTHFKDLVILVIDIFIVVGPSIGYFLQSLRFKKTKSSKGFSKSICLIIYFSQILRVFFWIGKPFKITLLYQSILIILFQIYLIHLWIKYHKTSEPVKITNQNQINQFNIYDKKDFIEYLIDWSDTISPNKIWNWTNQIEYYKFMFLIVIILLLISGVIGIHNVVLTNVYGTISVTSEASTLIPQIIVSCRTKNASNLSGSMVFLWFIGDSCKFVYNIKYKTPLQMIISGGFQIFLDFFCFMQILCYKDKKNLHNNEINTSVEINPNIKSKQVQQINLFMNKLEEKIDIDNNDNNNNNNNQKTNEDYYKSNVESNKSINKVEVPDKIENSDKIEVLDKSRDENIKYSSDEDNNDNDNDKEKDKEENGNKNKYDNNITTQNLKEEDNNKKDE